MALKPDREIVMTDISWYGTTVMERGGVMVASGTPGSGAAMDSAAQVGEYATNASGKKAIGLLINDFVNIDQNRQKLNPFKDEAQINTKAVLLRKGWVVTNMIMSNAGTGNMPSTAYVSASGLLTNISGAGLPEVGRFESRKDSDGYAKVYIDI